MAIDTLTARHYCPDFPISCFRPDAGRPDDSAEHSRIAAVDKGLSMFRTSLIVIAVAATMSAAVAGAQGALPTSQPNFLNIAREELKPGASSEHVKVESGWPAAYERAKSPDYYLAYQSMTGRPEVLFVQPFESHKSQGESMKRDDADPVLSAELKRLSRADAQFLTSFSTLHLRARKELSYGAFPEIAKQRFVEITTFRVRPGHDAQFEAAARAYGAAAKRSAPGISYRVYEIMAGGLGPTYYVFSSVAGFGEFDKAITDGQALMKGATTAEQDALNKFSTEALISEETQRYRVDPMMSYVPKETRATDPAFWMPKKPAAPQSGATAAKKPAAQ
jgi:hypothetical protein